MRYPRKEGSVEAACMLHKLSQIKRLLALNTPSSHHRPFGRKNMKKEKSKAGETVKGVK
jgi:hypothetical protein